jgi:monofunctional chorismate mutase
MTFTADLTGGLWRLTSGVASALMMCRMKHVTALDLEALRRDIDAVDQQILQLLHARVRLVLKVGEYKRQHGMQVYDPVRERQLLDRLSKAAEPPLDGETIRRVFERLVDESRRIEQHHVD